MWEVENKLNDKNQILSKKLVLPIIFFLMERKNFKIKKYNTYTHKN